MSLTILVFQKYLDIVKMLVVEEFFPAVIIDYEIKIKLIKFRAFKIFLLNKTILPAAQLNFSFIFNSVLLFLRHTTLLLNN